MKCPKCHFENPQDTRFCGNCATPLLPTEEIRTSQTETIQTSMRELIRGTTFARRYEVIEELGKGGMGRVYRVLDNEIKEEVALKLLKPEVALDENMIERFRNELKFARKIVHKNVCRMYDLSKEEETQYITMEYVHGEDLKSLIRKIGKFTIGKAVFIARQVCEGLSEAHSLGVVHRDLKPQNIMVDREGNARIMDFGIARSLKAKGITETGVIIGTPEYMSPEQVEGKDVDQRSDIYSLGVILYEMVTGRVPFKGDTSLSIAMKHKTEAPPNPRKVNAQIPENLSRLILRCMEKDKDKRYKGTEELLADLREIEKDIPTTDRILPKRKVEPGIKRKRFLSFVLPGIFLFVAIVIVAGYFFYDQVLQKGMKEKEEKLAVIAQQRTQETAALAPQPGYIEINSIPEGAEVYLGDKPEGMTPFKREIDPGNYRIRIKKYPKYKEITDVLNVKAGESSSKNYILAPVYILKINTIPEGADVKIDGNYKGKTPINTELEKSACQLRIEKGEEWSSIDESLTLKPGLNSLELSLERLKYSLSIRTNPSEARVSIGNKLLGISPVKELVLSGACRIKIEKEGYKTIEESINIKSDIERIYDLAELELVKIRLNVHPYANVFIDGELIGEIPPIKIQKVEEGKHTIEFVSLELNKKWKVEVEIRAGESKEIRMNMETGESKVVKISLIQ